MKEKLWTRNFILLVVASLGSAFLMSLFLNTLPLYAEQMTGTAVYAGLVTTCYSLASLATRPVVGMLCEKTSAQMLIIIGLTLMTVSCCAYLFVSAIAGLIFIRILHGIGFGIKSTASGVLAAEIIPKSRFAEGIGMFGLYLPVANAIGPALGLWVAEDGSFKVLFIVAGIIGVLSLGLMLLIRIPNTEKALKEKSASENTDELENIRKPPKSFFGFEFGVLYPSITLMLVYLGYSAIVSFIALYAISVGIKGIGLFFTIGAVALFATRLLFAKLVDRYGYHIFVLASTGLFAMVLVMIPHLHNIIELYIAAVFYGAALGIVPMAVNAQVLERCSKKRRGSAMAAYTSSMDLGIGIGSFLIGAVVDVAGFTSAFTLAGIICATGAVFYALTVARDHRKYVERMQFFS